MLDLAVSGLNKQAMRRGRSRKMKAEGGGLLRFIVIVAVVAWLFRSLVFTPFSIPSGSMLPTLRIGDYLLVAKWPYGYSRYSFPLEFPRFDGRIFPHMPNRGDVVVFAGTDGNEDLVKRVIGLPGDTVEVRGGIVILNGKPIPRDDKQPIAVSLSPNSPCRVVDGAMPVVRGSGSPAACVYMSYRETLPGGTSYRVIDQVENSEGDDFTPATVPAGHVFLMGDNRDDSLDSRFPPAMGGIGFVPVDHLIGRAVTILWSTDGSASYAKPWTWFTALRPTRIGTRFSEAR